MTPSSESALLATTRLMVAAGCSHEEAVGLTKKGLLISALEICRGNVCYAAGVLNVHRNTINRFLRDFGLESLPGELRRRNRQMTLKFPVVPKRRPSRADKCAVDMPVHRAVGEM